MPRAAIALGSNLGDRQAYLDAAVGRIRALGTVERVSSYSDTQPVENLDQPRFLNAVLLFKTDLPPLPLMRLLLGIELAMGRTRSGIPAKGPRTIDLDLIFYDEVLLRTPELTLPHPAMHARRFVLAPLAELAPEWRHPGLGKSVRELLAELPGSL